MMHLEFLEIVVIQIHRLCAVRKTTQLLFLLTDRRL